MAPQVQNERLGLGACADDLVLGPVRVDLRLAYLAAVLTLVIYGYEIFDFTLSIDEEVHTYSPDSIGDWVGQGRWGMAFLNAVLPHISAVPFIATVIFCAGLALGAALVAPLLARGTAERAFFVVLLVASPIWPHLAQFNSLSYGIGIGLVAVGVAAQAVFADDRWSLATSVASLALATAIYQTLPLAFLVVALIAIASRSPEPVDSRAGAWHRLARIAICFALAMAVYNLVRFATQRVFAASAYVDAFVSWGEYVVDFGSASTRTLRSITRVLGARHPIYLGKGLVFQLVGIAGLVGLYLDGRRTPRARAPRGWAVAALVVGAALAAVLPEIVATGRAPVRTLVPVPFLAAVVGARSLRIPGPRWPQWSALALVVVTATWISVSLFHSDAVARKRDELTAALLAERIHRIATPSLGERIPFLMVGYLVPAVDPALRRVEVFGASFFEHDMGNPGRMAYYLRFLGLKGLEPQPAAGIVPIAHEVDGMPSWPSPGSVALVSGTLVVKFGPLSPPQKRAVEAAALPRAEGGQRTAP